MNEDPGFRITDGKGFHITFENGYTVSVQFGKYNYCSNRDRRDDEAQQGKDGSGTAETAVWAQDGDLIHINGDDADNVQGWQTPEQVLKTINWAASQPAKATA